MKKRQNFSIGLLVLMGVYLVFTSSCEKDELGNSTKGKTTAVFNPAVSYGKMTDQDGNDYKTVTIGTQTWMAENLRTTMYNDGIAIPNVTGDNQWCDLTTGAYCNYKNTGNTDTIATYGRLYNWYAISTGKLAPSGWHVPTDEEWRTLTTFLGGVDVAGGKLKETGTTHWISPNAGATNETGFTALPGSGRGFKGAFGTIGGGGGWWSASEYDASTAVSRHMANYDIDLNEFHTNAIVGFSVRCVRD